jgi:hypothetical protein
VKIYLLIINQERHFFYSDIADPADIAEHEPLQDSVPKSGFKAWLIKQIARFREGWDHSQAGPMRWMRRLWDWLHSFAHPDEAMLVRLRTAKQIQLQYPAGRTEVDVAGVWLGYLNQQWWWHGLWLIVNGTIAPFAAFLAILPGPNIIGYWFLYRAVHHGLVVWGISRVLKRTIPTEYHALEQLDIPVEDDASGKATHPALRPDAAALDEHFARGRSGR